MEIPMQRLSAEKILAVWEAGRLQHALDRALTILAAASPEASREALAELTIGERDARLLQLRALVLGAHAEGFAECPRCSERVEFPLDTEAFTPRPEGRAPTRPDSSEELEINGRTIRFRLPTSRDLAQVVAASNSAQGLRHLVTSCIFTPNDSDSHDDGHPGYHDRERELPDKTIAAIGEAMLEADPRAEIQFRVICPACAHEWALIFDIAEFFWTELSAQAQRLLREIDTLARAYGWTEREILSLPAQRRQTYLEMLAA
jgi:hypothetical protein